jgi:hypothetical protein
MWILGLAKSLRVGEPSHRGSSSWRDRQQNSGDMAEFVPDAAMCDAAASAESGAWEPPYQRNVLQRQLRASCFRAANMCKLQ